MTLMKLIDEIEMKKSLYGYGSAPYKEARQAVLEAVEKLERDAARYVWLRANLGQMIVSREYPNKCVEIEINSSLAKFDEASLEAAIDAAMKEATNGQGN